MLAQSSLDDDEGGWRNNPKVAIAAILIVVGGWLFKLIAGLAAGTLPAK